MLRLPPWLGTAVLAFALTTCVEAQNTVTLAWNPSTGSNLAGYHLYEGGASQTYTNVIDAGTATTQTVSGLVFGGTYYFAVTAYDTSGSESDFSTEISYTVPSLTNPPPIVALTSPADGASFAAPTSINLAASLTASGHAITEVQFYNGATLLGRVTAEPYSFVWTGVGAGSYSLTASAVYYSGSTLASVPANVIVTNLPAPSIALTSPAVGASFAAPASINLAAQVTANGHAITEVQFYNGATLLGQATTAPYSFAWAGVGAGSYSLTALAVYDSGRPVASVPANVTITNWPAPSIALTSPAVGASFAAPASINLAANVTANGHAITEVQFYNGATLLGQATAAHNSFVWANVGAGNYSVSALAVYDSGSTIASAPANVIVTNLPVPSIALTAPAVGASFAAPASINLAAQVTANGHAIAGVQFYNGTTLLGQATTAPYSFAWASVGPGSYSLSALAVYDSGSTIASVLANVIVTNLPSPSIALTAPAVGASFAAPASINLAANVTANGHAIAGVQFYNGTTLLGQATTAPYSFAWAGVGAGSYSVSALAVYDSGSTIASVRAEVIVTNLPAPSIALTVPAVGAGFAAPASINLAAKVTANGHAITGVQFYNGATLLGQATAAHNSFVWANVGAGSYSLTALAVYDSGSTIASAPANVIVTNLPVPFTALTSPADGASFATPASINLAANVTANGHAITEVQFYNGATLLGQAIAAPYSFAWTNVGVGDYSLWALAVYDSTATAASAPANVTVTNNETHQGEVSYVTGVELGTPRNDYSGWMGMQIVVGANPLTVTGLGRMMAPGNSGTHVVKLVQAGHGLDVPGGAVTISMSGGTPGQFQYGSLSSPVTLSVGMTYWVLSLETAGGDTWYDWDTKVTTTGVALDNGLAWGTGLGGWNHYAVTNQAYVPVDFKY